MKLGFIGIGTMGFPMSQNLLKKSGCSLMAYDLNRAAVEALASQGAQPAEDACQVADCCDVVFTMLPRDEHVRGVYQQLQEHIRPGQIYVDMSTISPAASCEVAELVRSRGADLADAPVVKSQPAAVSGTLGIYVGAGLVMKLCHNLLVAQVQNGVNEVLHLAQAACGIDVETFAKAASYGGAQTFYLDSKAVTLQKGDFTPAFAAEYMHKDLTLAQGLCQQAGLSLEGAELAMSRYDKVLEKGWGKEDFSCTYKLFDSEAHP